MIIIRFEVSGKQLLEQIGLGKIFEKINYLEMIQAYQYDKSSFFSLQRLVFKEEAPRGDELKTFITKNFHAEFINILGESNKEVICILQQNWKANYFPYLQPGPWAYLFPITVTEKLILLNIITHESFKHNLFESISSISNLDYKISAVIRFDDIKDVKSLNQVEPYPRFTARQQEIAMYAAQNGFFESPKAIAASEIATHFDISVTAFNRHIRKIENTIMKAHFGGKMFRNESR